MIVRHKDSAEIMQITGYSQSINGPALELWDHELGITSPALAANFRPLTEDAADLIEIAKSYYGPYKYTEMYWKHFNE